MGHASLNLIEQIKALPTFLHHDVEYVDVDKVLAKIKPLMAHLQPENRPPLPIDCVESAERTLFVLGKIREYFEVLDNIIKGKEESK